MPTRTAPSGSSYVVHFMSNGNLARLALAICLAFCLLGLSTCVPGATAVLAIMWALLEFGLPWFATLSALKCSHETDEMRWLQFWAGYGLFELVKAGACALLNHIQMTQGGAVCTYPFEPLAKMAVVVWLVIRPEHITDLAISYAWPLLSVLAPLGALAEWGGAATGLLVLLFSPRNRTLIHGASLLLGLGYPAALAVASLVTFADAERRAASRARTPTQKPSSGSSQNELNTNVLLLQIARVTTAGKTDSDFVAARLLVRARLQYWFIRMAIANMAAIFRPVRIWLPGADYAELIGIILLQLPCSTMCVPDPLAHVHAAPAGLCLTSPIAALRNAS